MTPCLRFAPAVPLFKGDNNVLSPWDRGRAAREAAAGGPNYLPELAALLDRLSTNFFTAAFARQRLLNTFLFARFQIERVFFHFLNNVFLLNLAFETP